MQPSYEYIPYIMLAGFTLICAIIAIADYLVHDLWCKHKETYSIYRESGIPDVRLYITKCSDCDQILSTKVIK